MYTLQAMVAIAVKALVEKQEIREKEREVIEKKIQEAMEAAAEIVRENKEGWSSGGEDSDGGVPGPPLGKEKPQPQYGSPRANKKENSVRGNQGAARGGKTSWRRGSGSSTVRKPEREDNDAAQAASW